MSPDIPSSDPVSDFLQREQKAIEAIERNAHSFSNTRKRDNESKIPKPSKQEKEIDWEQVYEHMKNINYEEEAMNCGEDFLFLKERYEGKQLDPSVFNKMKAAHEECVREERQENDILVKKAKERSNEILSKIEEEEKLECEEQFHKYTQTLNKGNKEWSSDEKRLEDYGRVLDIYEMIPNAGRPERVIQMLKSVPKMAQ